MRKVLAPAALAALVVVATVSPAAAAHYQRFSAAESEDVIASFEADGQPLVEVRTHQGLMASGGQRGRGSLRFIDTRAERVADLGFYEHGAGLFSESMFEFFVPIVSVRNFDSPDPGRLDVRNAADTTTGIYLLGDGRIGSEGRRINFVLGQAGPDGRKNRVFATTRAPKRGTSVVVQVSASGEVKMKRVLVGRKNSGGDGFRILRVRN